jgi:hypothetical protein
VAILRVGDIVVRQAQDMAEFVADSADTRAGLGGEAEFAGASVGIEQLAIVARQVIDELVAIVIVGIILLLVGIIEIKRRDEVPVVGPDGGRRASIGLSKARVDDIDEVDDTILVVVILGEIHA